ncbi:hypothetical protein A6B35_04225 [Mesorhizobium amorphae CCNWGS0123]|nr:hypothetical protein A6B35_04225 [Mesorhizobium amorphae CCNWGS0123]
MLADIVDVTKDVVVPKAQDGPTILFQTRCPRFVGDNGISFRMLAAVDFDDEFLLWTREVDDVVGDRNLPPEAKPHQPMRAKLVPELQFG